MFIWGKIIGAVLGYFLAGNYIGAFVGLLLGHQLDQGILKAAVFDRMHAANHNPANTQKLFFSTVFSVMGHLAKADGHVSPSEIEMAQAMMLQMKLSEEQKKQAIKFFTQGKATDFPLEDTVTAFHLACGRNRNLKQMFLEILLFGAYADGVLHVNEQKLFVRICQCLGFSSMEFAAIESLVRAQQSFHQSAGGNRAAASADFIEDAYKVLGVDESASSAEVKKAYRRQMNKHHPDKLIAKGLPEEMLKIATEKTQDIQKAYDAIVESRKN